MTTRNSGNVKTVYSYTMTTRNSETPELRTCVKVEVDVLGSVPKIPTVSVDVKQHFNQSTNQKLQLRGQITLQ